MAGSASRNSSLPTLPSPRLTSLPRAVFSFLSLMISLFLQSDDLARLDNQSHIVHRVDILFGISVESHQIGPFAAGDGSHLVVNHQNLRIVFRRLNQAFQRRKAGHIHSCAEFVDTVSMASHVNAGIGSPADFDSGLFIGVEAVND